MGVQTAYGIEAEVSGYSEAFDKDSMLFMDFRRHHTGVWPSAADQCALPCFPHLVRRQRASALGEVGLASSTLCTSH